MERKTKREIIILSFFCSMAFLALVCLGINFAIFYEPKGKIENAELEIGNSERFEKEEIEAAMQCVLDKFPDFIDCDLHLLYYDEKESDEKIALEKRRWANIPENCKLVLGCTFVAGKYSGADGFDPGISYSAWFWYMERDDEKSPWRIADYGQG